MHVLWRMDEVSLSYIVLLLAYLPWILYTIVVTLFTISILYGRLRLHHKTEPHILKELPGVSIIKPLMGVDPYLEINLESHFNIVYPKFELLLCIQDNQDPAISLVQKLIQRYPNVDCTLLIGGKDGVLNPLVNNMVPGYEKSKYPLIWISTSRIQVKTEMLLDMVGKLQNPKVALVHQVPFRADEPGLAAAVEKIYFGANSARYYISFNAVGVSCFTGMSYMISKERLEEMNGLLSFGRYLAEDFFIAKFLHEKGYQHQLAAYPALQNIATSTIVSYKDRMVRWLRLRMNMVPFTCILEPLGECFILGVYSSWSAHYLFQFNPYIWFSVHSVVWCLADYMLLIGVQNGPLPFSKLTFFIAWLVRELLFIYIYFEALINVRHIRWGKLTYRLSNFGRTMEVVSDKSILPI